MRVVVIGAGEVGTDVARLLALEQHDVVVVDLDQGALEAVAEKLDVMTLHGNATSISTLQQARAHRADLLLAVTALDEVNIISCMIADRLGTKTTVARIRSDELTHHDAVVNTADFGIDMIIHPEESAADEVVRLIRRAGATDVLTFCENKLHLVGMRLDKEAPVVGRALQEISLETPDLRFRVMAIGRGIRTILPTGTEKLRGNDQVFVLAHPKTIPHVARIMGKSTARMDNVMILGGSEVGAKVAAELSKAKSKRVKLIEPDRARAQRLAERLPNVLVIHGDKTDIDLLVSEGLGEMDAFAAVTDDEESNLVTCLLAKHLEVRKTVALLSKGAYIPISQSIGLDAAVSTKLAVSREIMRFLRGKHVLSVATVHGLDAEVLEIEARKRSAITRAPLRDLKFPRGMLIGAVMHNGPTEVATGDTHIQAGDRAIVFVLPHLVEDAMKLFTR